MLDDIDPKTGDFVVNGLTEKSAYDDPTKYYQGVHTPTGETWSDFWAWWKGLCAEMDSKPKHIVHNDKSKKK